MMINVQNEENKLRSPKSRNSSLSSISEDSSVSSGHTSIDDKQPAKRR